MNPPAQFHQKFWHGFSRDSAWNYFGTHTFRRGFFWPQTWRIPLLNCFGSCMGHTAQLLWRILDHLKFLTSCRLKILLRARDDHDSVRPNRRSQVLNTIHEDLDVLAFVALNAPCNAYHTPWDQRLAVPLQCSGKDN